MRKTILFIFAGLLLVGCGWARDNQPQQLRARLRPGETLVYEFESTFSFSMGYDTDRYELDPEPEPCEYRLKAHITLQPVDHDENVNQLVQAMFSHAELSNWHCEGRDEEQFRARLRNLEAATATFQVGPHGVVGFRHTDEKTVDHWTGLSMITKAALDLLQTSFSDSPVPPGSAWKPSGQFFYWKEFANQGLELSGATMRYEGNLQVAGAPCAQVEARYVFSPTELPASATSRHGEIRGAGVNAVAESFGVSLLLNTADQHIVWLQRWEQVDNRLRLRPEGFNSASDDEPLVTLHVEESSTLRFLRKEAPVEWMAALQQFEERPRPEEGLQKLMPDHSLGGVARNVRRETAPRNKEIESDNVRSLPVGFTAWDKEFCENSWFCTLVSVAMPGQVELLDTSPLRAVYLAKSRDTATVTIGPILDRKYRGLTPEEELTKHSDSFLKNQVWLASGPATFTSKSSVNLDGHPALLTDFTISRRDNTVVKGTLATVLTEWGKVVPVVCMKEATGAPSETCAKVVASVRVSQEAPPKRH